MEFIFEGIALGVDFLILGMCFKEYISYKKSFDAIKSAPLLSIDDDLKDVVGGHKCQRYPYAVVQGTVASIGPPLMSDKSPSVAGVIQVVKLSERRVARRYGFIWSDQLKQIDILAKEVPFKITNGRNGVEVVDGLSASELDLDLVYDSYEPASLSFLDHIFSFLSSVRHKGFHTTEEILRDGSTITGIGEIELSGKTLRLKSSSVGPMILTKGTKDTLLEKFEAAKSSTIVKIVFCGTLSFILISIIAYKFYQKKKQERIKRQTEERKQYFKESSEHFTLCTQNNLSINYVIAETTHSEKPIPVPSDATIECKGQTEKRNCNLKNTLEKSLGKKNSNNYVNARQKLDNVNLSVVETPRSIMSVAASKGTLKCKGLNKERTKRQLNEMLEIRERQYRARPQNLKDDQLCVSCAINVKEVMLYPCGHVCLCEDCSEKILNCPVCRQEIETAAVIS